ncbi:MAG: hypothetical protein KAV87_27285 [Desulfobacteraceae bacterium]|nr:hypothetical protein [Desulfobacteraceae bacterium]
MTERYYGKYQGMVINNVDIRKVGRLLVQVPDVMGTGVSSWAKPCLPVTGLQMGIYCIPAINAKVWVEFEGGDPDQPIWVGGFWGSEAEVPVTANIATPGVPVMILESPAKNAVVISDTPIPPMVAGGIMLKSGASSITVGPDGVSITGPKIEINGLTIINNGALTVTL